MTDFEATPENMNQVRGLFTEKLTDLFNEAGKRGIPDVIALIVLDELLRTAVMTYTLQLDEEKKAEFLTDLAHIQEGNAKRVEAFEKALREKPEELAQIMLDVVRDQMKKMAEASKVSYIQ